MSRVGPERYLIVEVRVRLLDGATHATDSSAMASQQACRPADAEEFHCEGFAAALGRYLVRRSQSVSD